MKKHIKKASLYAQSGFYILAGTNHFLNPSFYYGLIPDYLPYHSIINYFSGGVEVVLGALLLFGKTRTGAVYGIILMLIAFIPTHVYFIQLGSCIEDGLCTHPAIGWIRLVLVHPLLMLWAWVHR